ncbi:MAG: hypothetical protein CMI16_12030 [Opitutaceae bacterium]|nr:hypothetical protein [Opitutaceae bacterium]
MPLFKALSLKLTIALGAVALIQPISAGQTSISSLSDEELIQQYRERAQYLLDQTVALTDPTDLSAGGMFHLAVNLHEGANLEWVKARLITANQPPAGAMFWMIPMVLFMQIAQDIENETGTPALTDDEKAFIRILWKSYFPYRGDTENHWIMYYVSQYLVAEMTPDGGPELWYNGKSSAENMAEAREYIEDWIKITTSYGQGEYDSPNYIEEYTRPMALLAGWAKDPVLRKKGKMMMDYVLLDYAVENINGLYGGAHSRVYPRFLVQPSLSAAASHGWLIFGQGDYLSSGGNMMIALSGYTPPSILLRIAHDRDNPYVHRELKRTRWRLRNAGPEAFDIGGMTTIPVYKYSYVHKDFILGSSQGGLLQPIQQQTWSLLWHEDKPSGISNTMFSVQSYSSPFEGTMYFSTDWDTVTDLISRSKVDYDLEDKLEGGSPYEQVAQHQAALIALYDIPEGTRFPLIHTYFSRDLKNRVEDSSGWIFSQGGPTYMAYRPLAPGVWKPVDWTDSLKKGLGGYFSATANPKSGFEALVGDSESYVSYDLKNGYIVQVASASDFESYESFQTAVKALPLEYSMKPTPSVTFTSLDGAVLTAEYGKLFSVDGKADDLAAWPLFDGPFAQAEPESESLEIIHDDERYLLDFKNARTETTHSSAK